MTTGNVTIGTDPSPFYFRKVWSGGDDPKHTKFNSYTCSRRLVQSGQSTIYWMQYGKEYNTTSYHLRGLGVLPNVTANDEIDALSRLAESIRGHNFHAGMAIAGWKDSCETLLRSSQAVHGLFFNLFTLNFEGTLRSLGRIIGQADKRNLQKQLKVGDVAGAVLTTRYAWLPMLSDVYEAAKAIETKVNKRRLRFRSSKSSRSAWNDSNSPLPQNEIPATGIATVRYVVELTEPPSTLRTLGLLDPLTVAWDRTPLSFLLDWFIPIGDYLSASAFFRGLSLRYAKTVHRSMRANRNSPPGLQSNWTRVVGGYYNATNMSMTRTVGTSLAVPRPSFKSVESAFGVVHLQNAAALLISNIGNLKRAVKRNLHRYKNFQSSLSIYTD